MMYPNIIAVSGYKNAGKDTTASMLRYLLNTPNCFHYYWIYQRFHNIKGKYSIVSFAHPLKKTLSAMLNIPIKRFDNRDFKENYYIYFPTLQVTNKLPDNAKILTDNKFSKAVSINDMSFVQNTWISIRQLLQVFGTECMRKIFGDKIWIMTALQNQNNIIISDLRFIAEYNEVKSRKGRIIYIKRDICKPGVHASEKEVQTLLKSNKFDYIIDNNGTLKDLFYRVKNYMKEC